MSASQQEPETSLSIRLRQAMGWACLISFPVAVVAALTGQAVLFTIILIAGYCMPLLFMIAHLNITSCLSNEQEAVWRRELWWGFRGLAALWTYLLSTDLKAATAGLAIERR